MKSKLITLILISLFSLILWGFVSLSEDFFATVKVPIVLSNLPEGYSVNNVSDNEVTLSLQGKGWQLAQIYFGSSPDFKINTQRKTGKNKISIRKAVEQNNWLSKNLKVIDFSPQEITYSIERLKITKVRISPRMDIDFKSGYDITSSLVVIPDSVEISGPESLINRIDSVTTKNEKFVKVDENFSEIVELEHIPNVSFKFSICRVEFEVQRITDRTFEGVPVRIENLPGEYDLQLFPSNVSVSVKGGINILAGLSDSDIKVYVDFIHAFADTLGYIEPDVQLPASTTLLDIKPKRLNYIIKQY